MMATAKQKAAARRNIKRARAVQSARAHGKRIPKQSRGLSTRQQNRMPAEKFAFPKQRKEPLNDAAHVRNAVARFDQVEGVTEPARSDLEAIRRFNARAATLLTGQPRVRLEEKPASTSVHFRADHDARAELGKTLTGLAEELGLRTAWGRLVLEVKPAEADKASALSRLLREDR